MRSELVFAAGHTLGDRFALCRAAAKATRRFHRAHGRIEDTTNEVLQRIAESVSEPVKFSVTQAWDTAKAGRATAVGLPRASACCR